MRARLSVRQNNYGGHTLDVWPFGVAHHMGAAPLIWVAWLRFRGKKLDVAWLWLAGAFFVSWLADTASHWTGHPLVSVTYPVTQAGIISAVFLNRYDAMKLVAVIVVVGVADVLWQGVQGPDILLRTVAWLSIVGIAYPLKQLGKLRVSLLVSFGVGWLAWMWYAMNPGWPSYLGYQGIRLMGILLFCLAAMNPLPRLRIE